MGFDKIFRTKEDVVRAYAQTLRIIRIKTKDQEDSNSSSHLEKTKADIEGMVENLKFARRASHRRETFRIDPRGRKPSDPSQQGTEITKEARDFLENLVRVHLNPHKFIIVDRELRSSYSTDDLIEATIDTLKDAIVMNGKGQLYSYHNAKGELRWKAKDVDSDATSRR